LVLSEGELVAELRGTLSVSVPAARVQAIGSAATFRVKTEPGGAARVEVLDGRVHLAADDACVTIEAASGALVHASSGVLTRDANLPRPPSSFHPVELVRSSERMNAIFSWETVGDAQAYRLELSESPGFESIRMAQMVAWSPSASVPLDEIPDGTFYYRVSTIHGDGFEGPPSTPRRVPLSGVALHSSGESHAAER
jgi:hypothetical protein